MKIRRSDLSTLVASSLIALGSSTASAQTVANGPYYATPSWSQQLPAATRFIVLANWVDANFPSGGAAVLDRETGLVWERSPSTSRFTWTFLQAAMHCNNSAVGNRRGWKLPTIQESASLIDPTVPSPGPTLPAGHPFLNVQSSFYYSATTVSSWTGDAWVVFFDQGIVNVSDGKDISRFVWCVRGGQGVDPQ
jgi:hypothetical protein